ncbi:MAG: hypothetical protein ITG02_14300 [Patulibacter sp.]|nr:hypothetical protein [Patulibacter sp.]
MDTAITILIFGIVGVSAAVCVAALLFTSGPRRGPTPSGDQHPAEHVEAPVDEAWTEAQALVAVRNARRRRRGEPESDPEVEAEQILSALERETR